MPGWWRAALERDSPRWRVASEPRLHVRAAGFDLLTVGDYSMQIDAPLLATAELNSILSQQIQERETAILAERAVTIKEYQRKRKHT